MSDDREEGKSAAFYRTQWLFAHNRLHTVVHGEGGKNPLEQWDGYLEDLKTANEAALLPA
jgi:hypothetical protein